jgi:hypothetical protein
MNVHQVKHAGTGLALTLVVRKIHAVQLLDVQFLITSQVVHVLLVLKVTHTPDVLQVSLLFLIPEIIKNLDKKPILNNTLFYLVKRGECNHDSECPDNKACNQYQCVNPCLDGSPCGKSAECEAKGHRAVCRCPSGWGGHPSTECYTCRLKTNHKIN